MTLSNIQTGTRLLSQILDSLPILVLILDRKRRVVLANQPCLDFSEKPMEGLVGCRGGEVFNCLNQLAPQNHCGDTPQCKDCRLRQAIEATFSDQTPQKWIETTMAFVDHGERTLRLSTSPLLMGGLPHVMVAIEDFTELESHRRARLEKERLAGVLETAGAVCHELSQPLQVITGFCDILTEQKTLDPAMEKAVTAIQDAVWKMARIHHDLLHITRYETKSYLSSTIIDIEKSSN